MNIDDLTLGQLKEIQGLTKCASGKREHGWNIVILQRGWVMVGDLTQDGTEMTLRDASVIRVWGTDRGLGQIAKDGPTGKTKLDPTNGEVKFHELTVVARIKAEESKWNRV